MKTKKTKNIYELLNDAGILTLDPYTGIKYRGMPTFVKKIKMLQNTNLLQF